MWRGPSGAPEGAECCLVNFHVLHHVHPQHRRVRRVDVVAESSQLLYMPLDILSSGRRKQLWPTVGCTLTIITVYNGTKMQFSARHVRYRDRPMIGFLFPLFPAEGI